MAKLDEYTAQEQLICIQKELREAMVALKELQLSLATGTAILSDVEAYGMELLDVMHATETALRMSFEEEDVVKLQMHVIEKNRKRGYYGD